MNFNILQDDKGFLKEDNKGRGRYDLIEPNFLARLYTASSDEELVGTAAHRMALRLEHGAEKYEPDNWKRGNAEAFDRSIFRHAMQALRGLPGEDHLGACMTTLMFRHFLCMGTDQALEGRRRLTYEERELAIVRAWHYFFQFWEDYKNNQKCDEEEGAVIHLAEQVGFLIIVEERARSEEEEQGLQTQTVSDAGHYQCVSRLI